MDVLSLGETGLRSHRSSARIARVRRLISGHGRYLGRGWCVVRARGSIQSPVLVGRDSFLALVEDRLAAAATGEGRLLFVAGEAGIGKTRLLSQRLSEGIRLPRLGLAQTAAMTSALLGRPAPAQMVQAIHERSDGIPLHVEELLAAIDEDTLTPQSGAAIQAATVPDTLGDA